MSWENLCRFCGIKYEKELDLKYQSEKILFEVMHKLFSINDTEMNLIRICTICDDFIVSLCKFYEKTKNVENLILEMKNSTTTSEISIDPIDNYKCETLNENISLEDYKIQESCITSRSKKLNDVNSEKKENTESEEKNISSDAKLEHQPSNTITLLKHKSRIPAIYRPKYKCKICNAIFCRESNFTFHNKNKHNIIEDIEPCNICGKSFSNKTNLRAHKKLHLSLEEREKFFIKCPHCDIKYPQRTQMSNHIRSVHSKERPFICESCGKAFTSQNNLYSHRKEAHEPTETSCSICKKTFKTLARMKNHKKTHKEPSIPCTICGELLKSRKYLKNHMLIHSDIKAYKCNYCQKEFKRDMAFRFHMLIHTDLKPFICRFCGKSFAHPSTCTNHEKQLHTYEYQNAVNKNQGINIPTRQFEKLPSIRQLHEMLEDLKEARDIK